MDEQPPSIDSFVIRFVHQPLPVEIDTGEPDSEGRVRGSVRHVQSNREQGFTDWEEVEAFIRQYVPALPTDRR